MVNQFVENSLHRPKYSREVIGQEKIVAHRVGIKGPGIGVRAALLRGGTLLSWVEEKTMALHPVEMAGEGGVHIPHRSRGERKIELDIL